MDFMDSRMDSSTLPPISRIFSFRIVHFVFDLGVAFNVSPFPWVCK